jgi:hypothetical protein
LHQMHPFYSIRPKLLFGCVLGHLENLQHVNKCKTSTCTEVAEMGSHQMHPFYFIGPKMMFACVLEHFASLRIVKRCKTFVSSLHALFWCTEVAEMISHQMHPFYSIGCKIIFICVLEQLTNHRHVKRCKNLCFTPECTILVYRCCRNCFAPNASILLHWAPNDV